MYDTSGSLLQQNGQQVGCWWPWSSSMPTTYFVGFQQLLWLASKLAHSHEARCSDSDMSCHEPPLAGHGSDDEPQQNSCCRYPFVYPQQGSDLLRILSVVCFGFEVHISFFFGGLLVVGSSLLYGGLKKIPMMLRLLAQRPCTAGGAVKIPGDWWNTDPFGPAAKYE